MNVFIFEITDRDLKSTFPAWDLPLRKLGKFGPEVLNRGWKDHFKKSPQKRIWRLSQDF